MKKYLIPILIAGAGVAVFFSMKKKSNKIDEVTEPEETIKPIKKRKTALKSLDVDSVIKKISTGFSKVEKFIPKNKKKKKTKGNTFISPLQPKPQTPKFY